MLLSLYLFEILVSITAGIFSTPFLTHVIVSVVYVRVADAAVLDVEGDILVPRHVPGDRDLRELRVLRTAPRPRYSLVHASHLDKHMGRFIDFFL